MWTNDMINEFVAIARRLPHGICVDNSPTTKNISLQAHTQERAREVRAAFPGVIWSKKWRDGLNWWEYHGTFKGWEIMIYACAEAPPACKAIVEKRLVKTKRPIAFETIEEEKDVIVGWDCGGEK